MRRIAQLFNSKKIWFWKKQRILYKSGGGHANATNTHSQVKNKWFIQVCLSPSLRVHVVGCFQILMWSRLDTKKSGVVEGSVRSDVVIHPLNVLPLARNYILQSNISNTASLVEDDKENVYAKKAKSAVLHVVIMVLISIRLQTINIAPAFFTNNVRNLFN